MNTIKVRNGGMFPSVCDAYGVRSASIAYLTARKLPFEGDTEF